MRACNERAHSAATHKGIESPRVTDGNSEPHGSSNCRLELAHGLSPLQITIFSLLALDRKNCLVLLGYQSSHRDCSTRERPFSWMCVGSSLVLLEKIRCVRVYYYEFHRVAWNSKDYWFPRLEAMAAPWSDPLQETTRAEDGAHE